MDTRLLIFHFSTKATENSATHTRHTWRVTKFHIFTSRMHCYAMWKSEFDVPSSNAILLTYTHPFAQKAVSLGDNKGRLHQHACPDDLPHNLDTPHSDEPPRPFVCTVAPMGRLQHLADYNRRRTSHTRPRPNSSAHGHPFHPGTQQGSPARIPSVTRPSCRYQGGVRHAQHGAPAMSAPITVAHKRMPCQDFAYN